MSKMYPKYPEDPGYLPPNTPPSRMDIPPGDKGAAQVKRNLIKEGEVKPD